MTTKRIISTRPDGGLYVTHPSPWALNVMTGAGGAIAPERIESQIASKVARGVGAQAARTLVEALAFGDLTEAEAIAAIQATDVPTDGANPEVREQADLPTDETFNDAWQRANVGDPISVNMPRARDIHGKRIAIAQTNEIARLKIEERMERLRGNTAQANQHAADITALEALNVSALATQIAAAATPSALTAIWPAKVPRTA